jgi:tetratricopeptide (TPR) repeat protein
MKDLSMRRFWILALLLVLAVIGCAQGSAQSKLVAAKNGVGDAEISRLTTLSDSDPSWANWLALGQAYSKNGQYQKAIDAYKKSVGAKIPAGTEWAAWYYIANAHEALGQTDAAVSAQKKAIELSPENADLYVLLAKHYYNNGRYDEAIAACRRALELKGDHAGAFNYLGAAYGKKQHYPEAMSALRRAIELAPENPNNYSLVGFFYAEQDAYPEAIVAYKKAIALAPDTVSFHSGLTWANYYSGRYDDAIISANTAIDLATIQGGIGTRIAVKDGLPVVDSVMEMGPAKTAGIEAGDKITEINGNSTSGLSAERVIQDLKGAAGTNLVLTIERGGVSSKRALIRGKVVTDGAAEFIAVRSLSYRYKGDLAKAFDDAVFASTVAPSHPYSLLAMGAAHLDRGEYAEAANDLAQVKDNTSARLLEATAYARQGKMTEATKIYSSINASDMSVKVIPQTNNRTALLQTFKPFVQEQREKAKLLESKGQYQEAVAGLSQALAAAGEAESQEILGSLFAMARKSPALGQVPENARKYAIRSEVFLKDGDFKEAASELKKAIQEAPYVSQFYYNAALIQAEMKQYREAIRYMKIYLVGAPDSPHARAGKDEIIKWELMIEKGR